MINFTDHAVRRREGVFPGCDNPECDACFEPMPEPEPASIESLEATARYLYEHRRDHIHDLTRTGFTWLMHAQDHVETQIQKRVGQ